MMIGLTAHLQAAQLILKNRTLLILCLTPVAISFVILIFLFWFGLVNFSQWMSSLISAQSFFGYGEGVSSTLTALAGVAAVLLSLKLTVYLITLLCSPFNDLISEKTEAILGVSPFKNNTQQMIRLFVLDLKKTLILGLAALIVTLFTWVPGINFVTFFAFATLSALNFLNYPLTRRGAGLFTTLQFTRKNFLNVLGFGIICEFLLWIPLLNFFAIPLSVVGATWMNQEISKNNSKQKGT